MNQGKLEGEEEEMARVNVDTLGISELKRTGMGEFNSDDLLLLLWAGIPYKKWSSLRNQQESLKCSTWMQSQKQQNDLCFQGKPFNIMVIQSMPQPVTLRKRKLNGSMKTYKTF